MNQIQIFPKNVWNQIIGSLTLFEARGVPRTCKLFAEIYRENLNLFYKKEVVLNFGSFTHELLDLLRPEQLHERYYQTLFKTCASIDKIIESLNPVANPEIADIFSKWTLEDKIREKIAKFIEDKNIEALFYLFNHQDSTSVTKELDLFHFFHLMYKHRDLINEEVRTKIFELIVENFSFTNAPWSYKCDRYNLLTAATHFSFYGIMKILLQKGLNANEPDDHQKLPVQFALERLDIEALKILKLEMPDFSDYINQVTEHGCTIFQFLCLTREPNYEQLEFLIESGADINTEDGDKKTPVQIALEYDKYELVKFLIRKDADVSVKTATGRTLLHTACEKKLKSDFIGFLLDYHVPINAKQVLGLTALHITCASNPSLTDFLLSRGADVNVKNLGGATPLMLAAFYGQSATLQTLLENHAQKELLSKENLNALHYACVHFPTVNFKDKLNCAIILMQNGIDFFQKDSAGKIPLFYLEITEFTVMLEKRDPTFVSFTLLSLQEFLKKSDELNVFKNRLERSLSGQEASPSEKELESFKQLYIQTLRMNVLAKSVLQDSSFTIDGWSEFETTLKETFSIYTQIKANTDKSVSEHRDKRLKTEQDKN